MIQIYITQFDKERLTKLLAKRVPHDNYDKALEAELARAKVVESTSIPSDVVTMNTHVKFRDEHGDSWDYTLVFPEDANLKQNKISILSPIGCSLIGYQVGDSLTIPTPRDRRKLTIEAVIYQPERSGDLGL